MAKAKVKKTSHEDCHDAVDKKKMDADFRFIRNLWRIHIDHEYNYGYLQKILNQCVEKGYTTDYMVFAMSYIVSNHKPLKYPAGFFNYLDDREIKDAYQQKKMENVKEKEKTAFTVRDAIDSAEDNSPKFNYNNNRKTIADIIKKQS